MTDAFIIMQIGNPELNRVCVECIVPAIEACGLSAKRIDKHNQGGLLKSEIIRFIESAEIIVADLTNERPNCYLEIGYTMGIDKFRNLILTAREDHNPDSINHKKDGPKVHFDLAGYDILFWRTDQLDEFRTELEKRIRRRLAVEPTSGPAQAPWDQEWNHGHYLHASQRLVAMGFSGAMEIQFALNPPKPQWSHKALGDAAKDACIHTFGWPIGVYLTNNDEYQPKPKTDGIVAEISPNQPVERKSYDYWALRRNGDFYLLKSLFEDQWPEKRLFFDTRIVRITEVFLYCARLYSRLGIDRTTNVNIVIRHAGLTDRVLAAISPQRQLWDARMTTEHESQTEVRVTLGSIEAKLVDLVKQVATPLFVLFNFKEFSDDVYEDIVNTFVQGRIT